MVGRRRLPQTPRAAGFDSINDPEIDMRREAGVAPGTFLRLRKAIRKLVLDGRTMVLPMRSIAREMEESWPADDV